MIGYLHGKVIEKNAQSVIIMTNGGVGYRVFVSSLAHSACEVDKSTTLRIHTIVREQEITLYGFAEAAEEALFIKLLSVSGIGPRSAMAFLTIPVNQTLQNIQNAPPEWAKKPRKRLF